MSDKYIVGAVKRRDEEIFLPVIGYEFSDSPGYFELHVLSSDNLHFRKRIDSNDTITVITYEQYCDLYTALDIFNLKGD